MVEETKLYPLESEMMHGTEVAFACIPVPGQDWPNWPFDEVIIRGK